jgi:RNA polymerase sigma-70 factor (ECF subfamily)
MMADRDEQFGEWMRAHLGALHRISRAFAEPADQHDLLQELMITVWKAQPAFRGDASPVTFIWRVAHNRALTWRRRETGRRVRTATAAAEMAVLDPPQGEDGDAELLERLYGAIRRLPALDRSIVLLSLEGAAYRDIGALHGMTETTVGARLTRARQKLTSMVEGDDDGL